MQRIGRNIASLGFSRIIAGLVLFIVNVRLAQYLEPEGFGKFSLVLAYYTIFLLFSDFGISRYVIKKVSEDKSLAPAYLGNFFTAQFFLGLLILLAFIALPRAAGYEPDIIRFMLVAGIGLLLGAMSIPFSSILQAWQKINLVARVYLLDSLVKAGWFILAILTRQSLVFIFWMFIIVAIMDFVIYNALVRKVIPVKPEFDTDLIKRMLLYGLPFAFISGFEILIQKIDVVIQKFFLPFSEVGLYSAAYRFLDFLTFLPAIVAISLFPYIAEQKDLQNQETINTFERLNRYMAFIALPLGIFSTILADKIILGLFGAGYWGAVRPFQVLIWATVLTMLYAVPNIIMVVKKTRLALLILSAITGFNIVSNILFIPKYGIMASAWITVISYVFAAICYTIYARKLASFRMASFIPYIKKDDWLFLKSIWQKQLKE